MGLMKFNGFLHRVSQWNSSKVTLSTFRVLWLLCPNKIPDSSFSFLIFYNVIIPSDTMQPWSCAAGKFICGAIKQVTEDSQVVPGPAAERRTEKPRNRKGRKTPFHTPAGHWGWGDMVHWATLSKSNHLLSICTNMLPQMNCHPPENEFKNQGMPSWKFHWGILG